jgi:mRNA-degrading endonuclease toxin of MazEF toxin-antitoxin module
VVGGDGIEASTGVDCDAVCSDTGFVGGLVAPITRTIRGIATEIVLDGRSGLRETCVATFDNLTLVRKSLLTTRIGSLGFDGIGLICDALESVAGR